MPQVLKDDVRARILEAARAELAERGYAGTTMATIAARAALGTGGIYRYYPSKDELVAAAIPAALVRDFEALLDRRVRALGTALAPSNDDAGEEIFRFWTAHRLAVVVLLDRAAGTPHADFPQRFVDRLVALSLEQLRTGYPGAEVDDATLFVLRRVFEGTRSALAEILRAHEDEAEMRTAVETFWTYQLAGLKALSKRVGSATRRSRRPPSPRSRPGGRR